MRTRSITYFCVTILLSLILINSCSDTVDPPEEKEDVTITLNPFDDATEVILSDATHYNNDTGDVIAIGNDEVKLEKDSEIPVRTEADGYETIVNTITFDRDRTVDISMTAKDPDAVEVTALAIDKETSEALDDLTFSIEGEIISTGVNQVILTEPQDTTLNLSVERDGYETADSTITFNEDKTVRIPLTAVGTTEPGDDEVTVTVWADDADTGEELDDLTFRIDGEIISAGVNRVILTEPQDTTIDLTIEQDGYESLTTSILFDEDKKMTVELEPVAAKTVSISITPEIVGYTDKYAANTSIMTPTLITENTVYYLSVGDSTRSGAGRAASQRTEIAEGVTTTMKYPAGPDPIPITMRAEYFPEEGHPYSDEYYLNVAEGSAEVPGDADSNIQLDLEHVPACSDGVDNNFTRVMDANSPGCIDYEASTSHVVGESGWVYDPDDNVELLQVASFSGLFGGNSVISVSSAANHRQRIVDGGSFRQGMQFALGQIDLYLSNKIDDRDNQEFAAKFYCGESSDTRTDTTGISDIVPDDPSVEGWRTSLVKGIDASFFASGLNCGVLAVHASKIYGNPPGDGNDVVIFGVPDTSVSVTYVWIVEPEMEAAASMPMAGAGKTADKDIQVQDVRTRDPRAALQALDPRRKR